MAPARRWIRLDVGWEESEWIAALPRGARLAWVLLLGHVKTRGIGGRAKAPSTSIIARKWDIPSAEVDALIRAAIRDGALAIEDGEWVVSGWARYQEPDPTAAERKRRERAARNSATDGAGHAVTTVTHRDTTVTRHATETETGTTEPPSSLRSDAPPTNPAKKRAGPLPSEWRPTDAHRNLAAQLHADLPHELELFRDHAEATGRLLRDWDAGFRTWLRKSPQFANGRGRAPPVSRGLPAADADRLFGPLKPTDW